MNRFVIEFGSGVDLHGMDVTKAAVKAVKDAVSHCCLCGLAEIVDESAKVSLEVTIGVPDPEKADVDRIRSVLPIPDMCAGIKVLNGGLMARGLQASVFGEGDHLIIANAVITVYVEEQDQ